MSTSTPVELSERELEILKLVATGASNKEIAQTLFISLNTVKVHVRNILGKIGASSRTEAAIYAVRIGLVATPARILGEVSLSGDGAADEEGLGASQTSTPEPGSLSLSGRIWQNRFARAGILALILVLVALAGFTARQVWVRANATLSPTQPAAPAPASVELAEMPTPRSGLAAVAFDSKIYVLGGQSTVVVTGALERYDPLTNAWESLNPMPVPVAEIGAAVLGGKIYIPGGKLESGEPSSSLAVYDPLADRWEPGAPLPVAVYGYALTAYEGQLYLFGGWDGEQYLATTYRYDPQSDTWESMTPMSTRRAYAGAALAADAIYVMGGSAGNAPLAANEVYFPSREGSGQNPWEQATPMPEGRSAMGMTSLTDLIYLIGGQGVTDSVAWLAFFPGTQGWQPLGTLDYDVGNQLAVVPLGGYLYILGGMRNGQPSSQAIAYQVVYTLSIPIITK